MALIRNMLFLTFEEIDTSREKKKIRKVFEDQGYKIIAETKIEATGLVKEWIMQGPVHYGKLDVGMPEPEPKKAEILQFNPSGGEK